MIFQHNIVFIQLSSAVQPILKVCMPAYSEPFLKPGNRDGCGRKVIWRKTTFGCMAGLTLTCFPSCLRAQNLWETGEFISMQLVKTSRNK